jgi:signal peptidase II
MKPRVRAVLLVCTTLGLVGCDHATKLAARSWLDAPLPVVSGLVELRYAENRDVAFSLTRSWTGPDKRVALIATGLVLVAGLLGWAWRRRRVATLFEQLAVAMVLAGALGNLIDRALRGYVVDFVWVRAYSVFNVADVLIVVGAIAMVLAARRHAAAAAV